MNVHCAYQLSQCIVKRPLRVTLIERTNFKKWYKYLRHGPWIGNRQNEGLKSNEKERKYFSLTLTALIVAEKETLYNDK